MDHSIKAEEFFIGGCNCAQAVVLAFSDLTGLDKTTSMKLASSFGGGIGRLREVCGAVSGMMMVLGLLYGYEENGEKDINKKEHYKAVQQLAADFSSRNGSIVCRDILKNPPSDPNPSPRSEEYYKHRPCASMVVYAARLLDQYIAEHPLES